MRARSVYWTRSELRSKSRFCQYSLLGTLIDDAIILTAAPSIPSKIGFLLLRSTSKCRMRSTTARTGAPLCGTTTSSPYFPKPHSSSYTLTLLVSRPSEQLGPTESDIVLVLRRNIPVRPLQSWRGAYRRRLHIPIASRSALYQGTLFCASCQKSPPHRFLRPHLDRHSERT